MQTSNTEYLNLTRDLVSMPSISTDLDALEKVIAYCEDYFSRYPFLKIKKVISNGKSSLIVGSDIGKSPKVVMIGHLDVVPAPTELFTVRQEKSLLYGRGVCDMKGSVAIMMDVLRQTVQKDPSLSVTLWLTTDEEIGGINGVRYLVDELQYKPKVALVPDGGSAPETVALKSKGLLPLKIHTQGTTSHASRPWEGSNAIEKLITVYQRLKALFPEGNITQNDSHWYSTAVMTSIQGGEANNVVPEHAECMVDIRLAEDTNIDAIKTEIEKMCQLPGVSIDILATSPVSVTKENDKYVQLYQKIISEELGKKTDFISYSGTNDSRHLTKYGIPAIVSRPQGGGQHSLDEWVDIESMKDFHKIYSRFIVEAQ